MLSYLENYMPTTGKTAAERLRNTPATLLVEWVPAIDELREQYRQGEHKGSVITCPLCQISAFEYGLLCGACPWEVFDEQTSCMGHSPGKRIRQLSEWRKKTQAELKRRGV